VARNEVFTEFFPIMVVMYTVGAGGPAPVGAPQAARMRAGLRPCVSHGDGGGDSKHRRADAPACSLLL